MHTGNSTNGTHSNNRTRQNNNKGIIGRLSNFFRGTRQQAAPDTATPVAQATAAQTTAAPATPVAQATPVVQATQTFKLDKKHFDFLKEYFQDPDGHKDTQANIHLKESLDALLNVTHEEQKLVLEDVLGKKDKKAYKSIKIIRSFIPKKLNEIWASKNLTLDEKSKKQHSLGIFSHIVDEISGTIDPEYKQELPKAQEAPPKSKKADVMTKFLITPDIENVFKNFNANAHDIIKDIITPQDNDTNEVFQNRKNKKINQYSKTFHPDKHSDNQKKESATTVMAFINEFKEDTMTLEKAKKVYTQLSTFKGVDSIQK